MRARVVRLGALATLAAAVAVVSFPGRATLALQVYSAFLAAFAVVALVPALATAYPTLRERPGHPPPSPARDSIAAELERLQRQVELGTATAGDLHAYLVPVLREVASRLLLVHGVDLDREPRRARQLLGAEAWDVVRPDRPAPEGRLAPGLSEDRLASVVGALEAL